MKHLLIILLCSACQPQITPEKAASTPETPSEKKFHYTLMPNADGSYGYQIYTDSILLIRQQNIPTRTGNSGFKDSVSAAEIAELVIRKLNAGAFPPSIDATEIDSILNKFP